jgi:lipoate synthase
MFLPFFVDKMRDLCSADCDILVIGLYLQPTCQQVEVADHVRPVVFGWYGEVGQSLGFQMSWPSG